MPCGHCLSGRWYPQQPHLHLAVYPGQELRHFSVHAGLIPLAAARPPAGDPCQVPAVVLLTDQGPSAVPLWRIHTSAERGRGPCAGKLGTRFPSDPAPLPCNGPGSQSLNPPGAAHLAGVSAASQVPRAQHPGGEVAVVDQVVIALPEVDEADLHLPQEGRSLLFRERGDQISASGLPTVPTSTQSLGVEGTISGVSHPDMCTHTHTLIPDTAHYT